MHIYLPSYTESTELDPKIKLFKFYNNIYLLLKKEIIDNYKDVYDLRRAYKTKIFHIDYPLSCEDLESNFQYINKVYGKDTSLDLEYLSKLK